jgi:hypothetical protein
MKFVIPVCSALLSSAWVLLFLPEQLFVDLAVQGHAYLIPYVLLMVVCYIVVVWSASTHAIANKSLSRGARRSWVAANFTGFWAIIYWAKHMR